MSVTITTEVYLGKGNHTSTMDTVYQDVGSGNPEPRMGKSDYDLLKSQYPGSPLYSSDKFRDSSTFAQYFLSSVFGRGTDLEGLSNFDPENPATGFQNSNLSNHMRKEAMLHLTEVPEFRNEFETNQVQAIVDPSLDVEPVGTMPMTSYYPNTASPSGELPGDISIQGVTTGPIETQTANLRATRQFGSGHGTSLRPRDSLLEIAGRMKPLTAVVQGD